jgi:serine/threonine-protein phosphatase 2B catalytic subunit
MDDRNSPPAAPKPARSPEPHPFDNAIRAVKFKKPVPQIDFTLHTMDDGSQVSTQERVCKGKFRFASSDVNEAAKPPRCSNR